MKNIKQIELIEHGLEREKEKYMFELSKVNLSIKNKTTMVSKMRAYKKEYDNNQSLQLSRMIPVLSNNFYLFTKKIEEVINEALNEINNLNNIKESILSTIDKIEKKIQVMKVFEKNAKKEEREIEERKEQLTMDDMVSTVHERRGHE